MTEKTPSEDAALQYLAEAEERARTVRGVPAGLEPIPILAAGVVGAGTMGGGIAMSFANAGIPVTLTDRTPEDLERGLAVIRKNYANSLAKGRLSQAEHDARLGRIRARPGLEDLCDADVVVEAVFELMEVKLETFARLDRIAKPGAVLASNTSFLDIDQMARATTRPGHVLGLHFFAPAHVMRLLEIVRGAVTEPVVLATAIALAGRLGKVPVVAGNCHGFIANRMGAGYWAQAGELLLDGAEPAQVDRVLQAFGFAMGPFAVGDLSGLDIGYRPPSERARDQPLTAMEALAYRLVDSGRRGLKSGSGFYDYAPGSRIPEPSAAVSAMVAETAREFGITRRAVTDDEILARSLMVLVNIGCDILAEGFAERASDIDVANVRGFGFPAGRGGPMYWAEREVGLAEVHRQVVGLKQRHGDRWWRPSPLLARLAQEQRGFTSLDSTP